jgi:DNA primase
VAGRINPEDIETLRERADALVVIGDHTELKRAGRNFKGLCPFHTEKTPSFNVMPDEGRWYCFGCSQGGDLFDFVMRVEGLGFVEAVESLARRTGMELRYEELTARQRRAIGEKARMLEVTRAATAWFQQQLMTDEGAVAREYLKQRGFGREDAERFGVGYAPNRWDALTRHLTEEEGFDRQDVLGVRLAKPNNRGGLRDAFKGRLVFPILDVRGDPIAFGGRVLPGLDYGDFTPPKYLNSEEYRLYQKTKVLYGLHEARAAIVSAAEVLVCEGYTDVMALHQAGVGNVVATCGTAVGPDHFRTLSKYANRIVLAFDGDEAGRNAARKAFAAAREVDDEAGDGAAFTVRVLVLPDGTDPADLVRDAGVEAVREAVAGAPDVVRFLLRGQVAGVDHGDEEARIAALRACIELLGLEDDPERRRMWARTEIAGGLGYSIEHVAATAARMGVRFDTHVGVARTASTTERARVAPANLTRARAARERAVLRFALQQPERLPEEWYELAVDDFTHPRAKEVMAALERAGGAGVPLGEVLAVVPDEPTRTLVQELAVEQPVVADTQEAVVEQVRTVLAERLDERHRAVTAELRRRNADTDPDEVAALLRELQALELRRRGLRPGGETMGEGGVG